MASTKKQESGPETPAKKSLRTAPEKAIRKGAFMTKYSAKPPLGYVPEFDEVDGALVCYHGPTSTVGHIRILRSWHPEHGQSFYIDNDDAYHTVEDLRLLQDLVQDLIQEAEAGTQK